MIGEGCDRIKGTEELNILILGLGNILLSDEGAGVRAIEALSARYAFPECVAVVDGGTLGLELAGWFAQRSHIIIVDAAKNGHPPGTITRTEGLPALFRNRVSPHQISLPDVLALTTVVEGNTPRVVLFGIEPGCLETGMVLSSEVAGNIDSLARAIVEELAGLGIRPISL